MSDTFYYYERRDGSITCTIGIDPFISNDDDTRRVFRMDGDRLKCVHDNDIMPWGYHLDPEESMMIVMQAGEPTDALNISDLDDDY